MVCSPTPWIFAFSGFSAVSNLDILGSCGSPAFVSALEGIPSIFHPIFLEVFLEGSLWPLLKRSFPCIQSLFRSKLFALSSLAHDCLFNQRGSISMMLHHLEGMSHSLDRLVRCTLFGVPWVSLESYLPPASCSRRACSCLVFLLDGRGFQKRSAPFSPHEGWLSPVTIRIRSYLR